MRKPAGVILGIARRGKVCKVRDVLEKQGSESPKRKRPCTVE